MASSPDTPDPWVIKYTTLYTTNTLEATAKMVQMLAMATPANVTAYAPYALQRLIQPAGTVALLETFLANAYVEIPPQTLTQVIAIATQNNRPDLANTLTAWAGGVGGVSRTAAVSGTQCHYCNDPFSKTENALLPCCHRTCTACLPGLLTNPEAGRCRVGLELGGICNEPFHPAQLIVTAPTELPTASPTSPTTSPTSPTVIMSPQLPPTPPGEFASATEQVATTDKYIDEYSRLIQILYQRQGTLLALAPAIAEQIKQETAAAIKTVEQDVDRLTVYREHLRAAAAARNYQRVSKLLQERPFGLGVTQIPAVDRGTMLDHVNVLVSGAPDAPLVVIGRSREDYRALIAETPTPTAKRTKPTPVSGWDSITGIIELTTLANGNIAVVQVSAVTRLYEVNVYSPNGTLVLPVLQSDPAAIKIAGTDDGNLWVLLIANYPVATGTLTLYNGTNGDVISNLTVDPAILIRQHTQITALPNGNVALRGTATGINILHILIYGRDNPQGRVIDVDATNGTIEVNSNSTVMGSIGTVVYLTNADRFYQINTITGNVTLFNPPRPDRWVVPGFFATSTENNLIVWGGVNSLLITDATTTQSLGTMYYLGTRAQMLAISPSGTIYTLREGRLYEF